jgi:sugar transferase EpsL
MYRRFGKRWLDLALSLTALALLWPLIALLALAVRRRLGTPVLFQQKRPGYQGKLFTIYKFRTMVEAFDEQGSLLPDAERLTSFGQFLRSTSLDELPEIINILKGEMSWVGPRPLMPQYLERYSEAQMHRHAVKPGLTGWAQINGRNALSWSQRFELDLWYVAHYSFQLDIAILTRTVLAVFRREGISSENHATMPEFQGPE